MTTGYEGASDRQLKKTYKKLLNKWTYYRMESYHALAADLEPQLRALSTEIQNREDARSDALASRQGVVSY